jgi:Tol biopolymer transport system component
VLTTRFTTVAFIILILSFILSVLLMCWIGTNIRTSEITFVHTDTRDIYAMDIRLGITIPLVKNIDASSWLSWSHDGNFLAFTRDFSVHIFNITDGSVRNYPVSLGLFNVQEPAWSPDDRYISFHAQPDTMSVVHIYLLRLSDGVVFPLAQIENSMVGAAWSPISDGTTMTLVYQTMETICGSDLYLREIEIDVANTPTTTNIQRLTNCGYQNMRPEWSPDGRRLVFYAAPLSEGQRLSPPEIFIFDIASGTRQQMTRIGNAYYPEWSADGNQIIFTALSLNDTCRVYIMDADGDNLHCLSYDLLIDISLAWRP